MIRYCKRKESYAKHRHVYPLLHGKASLQNEAVDGHSSFHVHSQREWERPSGAMERRRGSHRGRDLIHLAQSRCGVRCPYCTLDGTVRYVHCISPFEVSCSNGNVPGCLTTVSTFVSEAKGIQALPQCYAYVLGTAIMTQAIVVPLLFI